MNIDDAIKALNKHKYRGRADWCFYRGVIASVRLADGHVRGTLSRFAAIAVAEKMERDAAAKSTDGKWPTRDMPATRKVAPVMRRFAKEMAELGDDFVLSANEAGSYTVGDLRAAVAEWEGLS